MLRKALLFIFLPLLVLLLLAYATIPLWIIAAVSLINPYNNWQIKQLEVSYPLPTGWQIKRIGAINSSPNGATKIVIDNLKLGFNLQQGQVSYVNIDTVNLIQQRNSPLGPDIANLLRPSVWLQKVPNQLNIKQIKAQVSGLGNNQSTPNTATLSGSLEATNDQASIAAKLLLRANNLANSHALFLDAKLLKSDDVEMTLYTKLHTSAIAKMTSKVNTQAHDLIWQGEMVMNLAQMQPIAQMFVANQWIIAAKQGRISNHWRVHLPLKTPQTKNQKPYRDIVSWFDAAQGEHQIQLNLTATSPWAKAISLDTSLTQTLLANKQDQWHINGGSQMVVKPNWQQFNISPSRIDAMGLADMQLRLSARSPVTVTSDLNGQYLDFLGMINTTFASSSNQLFAQVRKMRYEVGGSIQGQAEISGQLPLSLQKNHTLLHQLPLDIQQIQALAKVGFHIDKERWKFDIAKDSNLSANQVMAQSKRGELRLFANDRLNLSMVKPLYLTYHPASDHWQWSDISLSLHPQTTTGIEQAKSKKLGLWLTLARGNTHATSRPNIGKFQLKAQDTKISGWPNFELTGGGDFTIDNQGMAMAFTGQAQPYSPHVNANLNWQWQKNIGNASLKAKKIKLTQLQVKQSNNWPIKATRGNLDYFGQWQWQSATGNKPKSVYNTQSKHQFNLTDVSGINRHFHVAGLAGKIEITDLGQHIITRSNFTSSQLQPSGYSSAVKMKDIVMAFSSSTPLSIEQSLGSPNHWQLEAFSAKVLGGNIKLTNPQTSQWQAQGLSVSAIAPLIYYDSHGGLQGTGTLGGHFELDEQWQINNINMTPNSPITLNLTQPIPTTFPSAQNLNRVLKSFKVSNLSIRGKMTDAKAPVLISIDGSSEQFNDEQKVKLNLKLNAGNVAGLLGR